MSVWEKLEGYLDTAVDAAAEGYVASQTPTPEAQPQQQYPEQTVTTVPANASDRSPTSMQRAAQAIEPYRAYLPWALIGLIGLWVFVRRGR